MRSLLLLAMLGQAGADRPGSTETAPGQVVLTQPGSAGPTGRRFLDRFRGAPRKIPSPIPAPIAAPAPRARPATAVSPRPNPAPAQPVLRSADAPLRRVQIGPEEALPAPLAPEAALPSGPAEAVSDLGSQPLSMEAALYGAITRNPDLVTLRGANAASAEAVEVARRFPVTLNPTLWIDIRPLVYERVPSQNFGARGRIGNYMDQKDALMYFSLRQPIELGHQTTHRYNIAKAAYTQQQWTVVQAELTTLVQTYRFFQTAAYRREKLRVSEALADFNDRLVETLRRRLEASQVQAADVTLAEVEAQATRQLVESARQDYATALADLRNQIGLPESANSAEPLGEFILPGTIPQVEDAEFVSMALANRPDLHAARAVVTGAKAAVCLAKGDKIPTPVAGPVYERDEQGTQFFGFVYITPLPTLNNGQPLVRQREAELRRAATAAQQTEQRITAQVRAAVAKWNGASRLVSRTAGLPEAVRSQIAAMERLFEAGQADLTKLLQARRSLIQVENARLDALWAATQAQADLLTALGPRR